MRTGADVLSQAAAKMRGKGVRKRKQCYESVVPLTAHCMRKWSQLL